MATVDPRDINLEEIFSLDPLPADCIDAANRAYRSFDNTFPGWQLYSAIVRGDTCFDRELRAWAILGARALSRARCMGKDGKRYAIVKSTSRGNWIAHAGMDALACMISDNAPCFLERSKAYDVNEETYAKLFRLLVTMMRMGFANYTAELYTQFWEVRYDNRDFRFPESKKRVVL